MKVQRLISADSKLKKGIECMNDPTCDRWIKGYIYEVPKGFHINESYFKILDKKIKVGGK